MEKGLTEFSNYSGDVILISFSKKSGTIHDIWPASSRLHDIVGKQYIGKKITSFLTPASKKVFKYALAHKSKYKKRTITLEFCSKKMSPVPYACSIWHARSLTLV